MAIREEEGWRRRIMEEDERDAFLASWPERKQCPHPRHAPPAYISLPSGMSVTHQCPMCGRTTTIHGPNNQR